MDEISAESLVRRISSIGERFGFVGDQGSDDRRKHKYDIWIANQVRKELLLDPRPEKSILDRENEIFRVLDWATETRPNLTSFSFEQAFDQQKRWAERLRNQGVVRPQPLDTERIIYRYHDGHFLYLLKAEDLEFEGSSVGHCVGGDNFKKKVNNQRSIIISLRDGKNAPHVTIEVALMKAQNGKMSGTVVQQQGKGGLEPSEKYHSYLREFALFSNGTLTKDDANLLRS